MVLLVLRSICGCEGGPEPEPEAVGWIDPATGVFTPGLAPDGAGPCSPGPGPSPESCATVAVLRLCDHTTDPDTGETACTEFLRFLPVDCEGTPGTPVDRDRDGVTPYLPDGEVVDCSDCACTSNTKTLVLCDWQLDGTKMPFVRTLTYDCDTGEVLQQADSTPSGEPYTPVGEVDDCDACHPLPMCPQLVGISGPDTWTMPTRTESVTVTVVCGPVDITDCAGATTTVNECGTGFTWSAPPGDCIPGRLCGPFTVDVPYGSAAYIQLLGPCDLGDVS